MYIYIYVYIYIYSVPWGMEPISELLYPPPALPLALLPTIMEADRRNLQDYSPLWGSPRSSTSMIVWKEGV